MDAYVTDTHALIWYMQESKCKGAESAEDSTVDKAQTPWA